MTPNCQVRHQPIRFATFINGRPALTKMVRIVTLLLVYGAILSTGVANAQERFALLIGNGAAYLVLDNVMELPFTSQPLVAFLTVLIAVIVTISLGLAGTLKSLSAKPARILRAG